MRVLPLVFLFFCVTGCNNPSSTTPVSESTSATPPSVDLGRVLDTTVGGIPLERKALLDGRLSMLLPKSFTLMGEEMLRLKYPSERRPTVVYTNEAGSVNIGINFTTNPLQQGELKELQEAMDTMFHNMYPSATWFESDTKSVNGREWLILDFRGPAMDTEIRNIMMGISSEGRALFVSFNAVKSLEETWLEPAKAMLQSLTLEDPSPADEH